MVPCLLLACEPCQSARQLRPAPTVEDAGTPPLECVDPAGCQAPDAGPPDAGPPPECEEGDRRPCGLTDVGACRLGVLFCLQGSWGPCAGAVDPTAETCNGEDDNCDGVVDEGFDQDQDGFSICGALPGQGPDPLRADCNDASAAIHPGAAEVCNGLDEDCDGIADNGFDQDQDGVTTCLGDCDDQDPAIALGKAEVCDGKDKVDETCTPCSTDDKDKDGQSPCQGDCDDGDAKTFSGATELCDGKDNDCNANTVQNCDVGQSCGFQAGTDECKDRLLCAEDQTTKKKTCGSFCNFSLLGAGLGDGCRSGESCGALMVIGYNNHLCTASGTTGTKLAGEVCGKDGECKSNR